MLHPVLPAPVAVAVASTPPASGEYGQFKLAFAGGRVSGAFNETRVGNGTEAAPQFGCLFALTGAWRGGDGSAPVLTWWPGGNPADERIPGQLTVHGVRVTLMLREDPGGCAMMGESLTGAGFSETLSARRPWLEVREVASARAALRDAPGGPPRRSYVVRGDQMGVLTRAGRWVRVQYVDGRRPVGGWLALADLAPALP